jgi:hypothetical protein
MHNQGGEGGGSAICSNENNALKESNKISHGGGMQNINCRMKIAVM